MKVKGTSLYQWQANRKLVVSQPDEKDIKVVCFANAGDKESLVVLPKVVDGETVFEIPNILLQSGRGVAVYSDRISEAGDETVFEGIFPVRPRPKPADYVYEETEVLNYRTLSNRIDDIEKNGVPDKQIEAAVKKYLDQYGAGAKASIGTVDLIADAWVVDGENLYSQVVDIDGTTENSQVDLTPSVEQLVIFYEKDLTFVTENDGGVVTVFAIGQKPERDYTIQVTITEVSE